MNQCRRCGKLNRDAATECVECGASELMLAQVTLTTTVNFVSTTVTGPITDRPLLGAPARLCLCGRSMHATGRSWQPRAITREMVLYYRCHRCGKSTRIPEPQLTIVAV